jgi:Tol biopolymer transport system component
LLDIWTFDAGGGDGVRITSGAWLSAGTTIAWSPDATQLAYDGTVGASFGEGAAAIFLVDADGSNPHPILTGLYGSPTWSPDGTSLLLVSAPAARSDWHNDVVVLDLDSGELTRVTQETATYSTPTWSPDGASVLAAKAGMVDANDQDIVRIDVASGEETVLASGGWNGNPVASPDGSRFAFAHADDGADGSSVVLVASTTDGGQAHEIYAGAWRSYPTSWR